MASEGSRSAPPRLLVGASGCGNTEAPEGVGRGFCKSTKGLNVAVFPSALTEATDGFTGVGGRGDNSPPHTVPHFVTWTPKPHCFYPVPQ